MCALWQQQRRLDRAVAGGRKRVQPARWAAAPKKLASKSAPRCWFISPPGRKSWGVKLRIPTA